MAHLFSNRPSFANISDDLFEFGSGKPISDVQAQNLKNILEHNKPNAEDSGPLWAGFDYSCEQEYLDIVSGDLRRINKLVGRLFGSSMSRGFLQGTDDHNGLKASENSRLVVGSLILDRFYRLAEAVGATRVLSAEHGQTQIQIADLDSIMARIEDEVGADLPAPDQDGGMFGLRLRGGIYTERHFDGIYAAWRAREVVRISGVSRPALCEIGGGAGHLAFYARQLGFRTCAIIDLPQAMMVQYIVLSTAFGDHRVSAEHSPRDGIELVQAGTLDADNFKHFDVVINVDSLPEMPHGVAEKYLSNISRGQTFVSINQESGLDTGEYRLGVVRDLASKIQLKRSARYPAWLRTGYVEEIYTRRA